MAFERAQGDNYVEENLHFPIERDHPTPQKRKPSLLGLIRGTINWNTLYYDLFQLYNRSSGYAVHN